MREVITVNLRVYRSLIQLGLNKENWVIIDIKLISQMVGITPRNVSRALNFLINEGYILKGKKTGVKYHYKLLKTYNIVNKVKEVRIHKIEDKEKIDLLVMKLFKLGQELQQYKILLNSNSGINQEQTERLNYIEQNINEL